MRRALLTVAVAACGCGSPEPASPPSDGGPVEDSAPPNDEAELDAPFTTEGITLVEEIGDAQWKARLYRHSAYVCGVTGAHVFVVVQPATLPWSQRMPLWVNLHGGGIAVFTNDGRYVPERLAQSKLQDEPTTALLLRRMAVGAGDRDFLAGGVWPPPHGLQKLVASSGRFRILLPSMCDNDTYSGVGRVDRNNPNRPLGKEPRVDGLLSNRAALAFTTASFPTSKTVLKGCSAGAIGAMSLAYRMARERQPVAAVIPESAVIHPSWKTLYALGAKGNDCFSSHVSDPSQHEARVGPLFSERHMMHAVVARRALPSPIHLVWSTNDAYFCGDAKVAFGDLSKAIGDVNPGSASIVREVCTEPGCATHCPLDQDGGAAGSTTSALQQSVFEWALARIE